MLLWKEMPMEMENGTSVQEFTLEGFPVVQHVGKVLFMVHLLAYLASLTGNVVIVTITCVDSRLQTPMYFFLSIFSIGECCFTSSVIPKLLVIFLLVRQTISFPACFIQAFVFIFLGAAGFLLMAVMSVDRYVAICKPLHYPTIMNLRTSLLLVAACIALGLTLITVLVVKVSQLSFCGPHVIPHFFCDLGPLIHLSCSDTRSVEMLVFVLTSCILLASLIITIIAYSNIVVTIVCLPSAKERRKAFSTCSSHLIVLSLMYGSCVFIYVKPKQTNRLESNRGAALVNTVLTPLLNPVIYTLRNKQVHQALRETMCRIKISR
ncbi:olfactory receptor family 6 subfamily D member 22 [Equus caballus]|uniref:Olfactory receptor n=1 Tax=Equus caballus TaxID=9796 RepID=F6Y584_HORSE|nr:olfactory receptor family 6 subfamily D member 22 [Equus caballus]XP_008524966.1 PREDICTED: olfactory receptor 6C74-like [Equus przewalskii]